MPSRKPDAPSSQQPVSVGNNRIQNAFPEENATGLVAAQPADVCNDAAEGPGHQSLKSVLRALEQMSLDEVKDVVTFAKSLLSKPTEEKQVSSQLAARQARLLRAIAETARKEDLDADEMKLLSLLSQATVLEVKEIIDIGSALRAARLLLPSACEIDVNWETCVFVKQGFQYTNESFSIRELATGKLWSLLYQRTCYVPDVEQCSKESWLNLLYLLRKIGAANSNDPVKQHVMVTFVGLLCAVFKGNAWDAALLNTRQGI